jgi:hypothetical protein
MKVHKQWFLKKEISLDSADVRWPVRKFKGLKQTFITIPSGSEFEFTEEWRAKIEWTTYWSFTFVFEFETHKE